MTLTALPPWLQKSSALVPFFLAMVIIKHVFPSTPALTWVCRSSSIVVRLKESAADMLAQVTPSRSPPLAESALSVRMMIDLNWSGSSA